MDFTEPLLVMHPIDKGKNSTTYAVCRFRRWSQDGLFAIVENGRQNAESSVPAQSAVFITSDAPFRIEYRNGRKTNGNAPQIEIVEKDNTPLISASEAP